MSEARLVEYLLNKGYIKLPTKIFKHDFIIGLDKALSSGSPIILAKFFAESSEKLDEYLERKNIDRFMNNLLTIHHDIEERYGDIITSDDEKILKFLVSINEISTEDFLEIAGPLYFISEVIEDIEKHKDRLSETILMTVFMWTFVNIYELILHNIDRKLYRYLQSNKDEKYAKIKYFPVRKQKRKKIKVMRSKWKKRKIKKFMDIKRQKKHHATAGLLNDVICIIINLPQNNSSIFGESSKPKLIRNKISHSNLFYDSEKHKIVVLNGPEYTLDEFIFQYSQLYGFVMKWMEYSLNLSFLEMKTKLKLEIKKSFEKFSRFFHIIERSGNLKKRYHEVVIEWKRKAAIK